MFACLGYDCRGDGRAKFTLHVRDVSSSSSREECVWEARFHVAERSTARIFLSIPLLG